MRVFCKVGDADKNGGHKGKVDGDLRQDIAYQFKHGCAIAARLQTGKPLGIAGKEADQCGGKRGGNPPGQRVRGANQIRREECGQRGYSHCDGIKKTARDAQRLTQRSDNEREFANLRQAHPDAHRCAAILPGGESAQTAGKNFSEYDHCGNDSDRPRIVHQNMPIQHQPDRNEKDRAEHIAQRDHQPLDRVPRARFGHNGANQESAERDAIAQLDTSRQKPKHTPRIVTSRISSRLKRATVCSRRGTVIRPIINETVINSSRRASVVKACVVSTAPLLATPESNAIIAIARMSSTIKMPNTTCAKRSRFSPSSSSALTMMVVDEIASIAPRKNASIVFQPKLRPIS